MGCCPGGAAVSLRIVHLAVGWSKRREELAECQRADRALSAAAGAKASR